MSYTTVKDVMAMLSELDPDQIILCSEITMANRLKVYNVDVKECNIEDLVYFSSKPTESVGKLCEAHPSLTKVAIIKPKF